MKKEILTLEEKRLVGIKMRTSYQNEINPATGKISSCVSHYFQDQVFSKIPHVKNPSLTFCAYTDYESDYKGDYTYFIGQEVTPLKDLPNSLESLIIPSQTYVKFTTDPGPMPHVLIEAWQQIWQMSSADLGGTRTYKVDFEVYDERTCDPHHTIVDLYIGIKN